MSKRFIPLLALVALSLTTLAALSRAHRRRLAAKSGAVAHPLQTWEGEGGGLTDADPAVAQRTTVTPED